MAFDISAYNVQGYIHKLENLQQYEFPFERLRRVEEQYLGKKVKKMGEDGIVDWRGWVAVPFFGIRS